METARTLGLTKVKAVRNPNYQRHGTKSYVYLLNRFGFQPTQPGPYYHQTTLQQRGIAGAKVAVGGRVRKHTELVKKLADGSTGKVTAEDQQNDSEYLCDVPIGTPGQTLKLDFDTGSADLWVFSSSLSSDVAGSHSIFDPSQSSTWKSGSSETWNISYGDGSSASGAVGFDTINLGGVQVPNQCVELAQQLSTQFAQGSGDGLLGLAFPTINTVSSNGQSSPQDTPVANMIKQSLLPSGSQLFTSAFYSSRDTNPASFYTFGYIDESLVTASGESITWTDIDSSQGFWMFQSESATVNGSTISQAGNQAIADTGTTLALVSDQVCQALYAAIPGASYSSSYQGYIIPNTITADQLPTFSVAVGGKEFVIQKEDLLYAPADSNNWFGGVQSRGTNTFDILGDTFLKSIYAIWDQGNTRFGACPKLEAVQNVTFPSTTGQ